MTSRGIESLIMSTGAAPQKNGHIGYRCTLYPGWISSRRFLRQMQKDNIDCALLQQEISHRAETKFAKGKLKNRVLDAIRGPVLQLVMCSLVLIDALIVTAEIVLDIHAVKAEKETLEVEIRHLNNRIFRYYCTSHVDPESIFTPATRDACCQKPTNHSTVAFEAITSPFALCCHAESGTNCGRHHNDLFTVYHSVTAPADHSLRHCSHLTCCLTQLGRLVHDPRAAVGQFGSCHFFHTIACILHFLSISILCIFVIQLVLKVVCMGRAFFKLKFEIVDGIIIIVSLIADAIFVYIASDEITLIIVFLIWRIVRVVNSLLMHEKQRNEFRIQLQKRARRISELKVEALNARTIILEKHIESLESLCVELGVPREQLLFCRPSLVKAGKEVTKNAIRSMAFLTSEIITQFAVGMNPKGSENSNANSNNPSATNSVKHLSLDSQQDQYPPPLSRTLSLSPPTSPLWTRLNPS